MLPVAPVRNTVFLAIKKMQSEIQTANIVKILRFAQNDVRERRSASRRPTISPRGQEASSDSHDPCHSHA